MIIYIKKNPIKFIFVGLLTIILGLNYFGFCYRQMRFLSDEEKIRIVVENILFTYPKQGSVHEKLSAGNELPRWKTVKSWPENSVPYYDINEFFALNPNCCQVATNYTSIGGEGDTVSVIGRLTGLKSSIVGVRYLLRYRDEKGIIQAKLVEIFPGISNCGELGWDLG